MWSLPDIHRLNEQAATKAAILRRAANRKRKPNCGHYRCKCKADESFLIYDIFSDDPKDVLHLCASHIGYSGDPAEGYFTCEQCQRVTVENYTWEIYRVTLGDRTLCLRCAATEYFADPASWIDPREVDDVVLDPSSDSVLFVDGILNVAKCAHVLGVKQPLPAGITFFENAEFDSMSGHQISGESLLDVIKKLNQPFCPVLDAAYQFAVSIGIYVRGSAAKLKEAA